MIRASLTPQMGTIERALAMVGGGGFVGGAVCAAAWTAQIACHRVRAARIHDPGGEPLAAASSWMDAHRDRVDLPVAEPAGAPADVTIDRDLGYPTTRTTAEWVTSLEALLESSSSQRQLLGTAAKGAVETGYTFDAWQATRESAVGLPARPAVHD